MSEKSARAYRRGLLAEAAAQYWLAGHPDFTGHDIAFDVVLAAPWAWPRYIANAFPV